MNDLTHQTPQLPPLKFKRLHPDAVIPHYATPGSAGLDLTATEKHGYDRYIEYRTGLAVEIPYGYVGLLFPRSSITDKGLNLKNSVGVIDSDYRGEVRFRFQLATEELLESFQILAETNAMLLDGAEPKEVFDKQQAAAEARQPFVYEVGDKVGQLVILPLPFFQVLEADELSSTKRGKGGFGHTGK